MKCGRKAAAVVLAAGCLAGAPQSVLFAQPVADAPLPPGVELPAPAARQQSRNPFAVTNRLVNRTPKAPVPAPGFSSVFTPQKEAQLPKMRLRGHVLTPEGAIAALLEIEGGDVHIVREGDDVGLHDYGLDVVIRIKKIDRLHVVIESGTLEQLIIVR